MSKPVQLLINIDGIPSAKSSASSFWPLLGLIKGEITPFPIGVFHGMSKPDYIDEYFTPFIKEMDFIMAKGGIDVETSTGEMQRVQIKITAFTAENPAKSASATGTAGHYC
jgi:hypothetical protein